MTDNALLPVYVAARAVIDYMDKNSGACTGQLLNGLRNALAETDDLAIPEFLRRKRPAAEHWDHAPETSNEGLEDLL
jgi:hypothetical protein